jgi:hypothetical protein
VQGIQDVPVEIPHPTLNFGEGHHPIIATEAPVETGGVGQGMSEASPSVDETKVPLKGRKLGSQAGQDLPPDPRPGALEGEGAAPQFDEIHGPRFATEGEAI